MSGSPVSTNARSSLARLGRAACAALLSFPALAAAGPLLPEVTYPAIAGRAADAAGFVPEGWKLEQEHRGDLDGDGRDDLVMVLKMDDPGNRVADGLAGAGGLDSNPRILVAAFAEPGHGYRRVLADHRLIPRPHSPSLEDYFDEDEGGGVGIVDGALRVHLRAWASSGTWTTSQTGFTFRWRDGCFRLVGHDHFSLHRASGGILTTSANYLTRRAWTSEGSISDDGHPPREWVRLPEGPPMCLEDVGNGLDFDPGIPAPAGQAR